VFYVWGFFNFLLIIQFSIIKLKLNHIIQQIKKKGVFSLKIITTVKRINYRKPGDTFTVFTGKINRTTQNTLIQQGHLASLSLKFVGKFFFISLEDQVEVEGEIEYSKKYGELQFICNSHKKIIPHTSKALSEYLHRFTKLGKASAIKVVNHLGSDCLNIISDDWKSLISIPGIKMGEKKAKKISYLTRINVKNEEMITILSSIGIPYYIGISICEYLNADMMMIRKNPYCISHIATLSMMDKIANYFKIPFDAPVRIRAIILEYLKWNQKFKGHLFVYKDDFLNEINDFVSKTMKSVYSESYIFPKLIIQEAKNLIEEGILTKEDDSIYLTYNLLVEKNIAKEIIRHINAEKIITPFREDLLDDGMADEQREAVKMALSSNISILGGGPGTGKTFTLAQIIKNIQTTAPNAMIQLGAPTGKAAKRITESTGMQAKTLHRMMGLQTDFIKQDIENTIVCDFLIIDESSMIDSYLFLKLLEATPEECKILLVGDFQQLPSVGAGNVLEDLIESSVIPVTELKKIFRQGANSDIIVNSHAMMNNGEIKIDRRKDFYFYEEKNVEKINERIMKAIDTLISSKNYPLEEIQVLSPMKSKLIGVAQLNKQIQDKFNKSIHQVELKDFVLKLGDRVIQTENNYELGVFNGEVGIIKKIDNYSDLEFELIVDFGDKEILFDEKNARRLELAYAMTIHKSQGSEFRAVIMPVHSSHKSMLNKNLVYTGWTRAKEILITYGEIESIKYAQSREDGINRNSKIKERLIEEVKKKK
jgi:exodeoxyribonuclease V alpha subunit